MYPVVNECTHRQIVRVLMPECGLSWHLALYLQGTGKVFLSLTSGCLEDACSPRLCRGVGMVDRAGQCHAHKPGNGGS